MVCAASSPAASATIHGKISATALIKMCCNASDNATGKGGSELVLDSGLSRMAAMRGFDIRFSRVVDEKSYSSSDDGYFRRIALPNCAHARLADSRQSCRKRAPRIHASSSYPLQICVCLLRPPSIQADL